MNENETEGPSQEDQDFVAPETGGDEEKQETGPTFVETAAMAELHRQMIEVSSSNPERFNELAVEWTRMSDELVDPFRDEPGDDFHRMRIGSMMVQAVILREAGKVEEYYEITDEALYYAQDRGLEDMIAIIRAELGPS